jgi:hypothetical protein
MGDEHWALRVGQRGHSGPPVSFRFKWPGEICFLLLGYSAFVEFLELIHLLSGGVNLSSGASTSVFHAICPLIFLPALELFEMAFVMP